MNKLRFYIFVLIFMMFVGVFGTITTISAQESTIPSWVKGIAGFWVEDKISDDEFLEALQFLINTGVLTVVETKIFSTEMNPSVDDTTTQMTIQEPRENLQHQKNIFFITVNDDSANEDCKKLKNYFNPRLVKIKETDTIKFSNIGGIQHNLSSADRYGEPDNQQFYNQIMDVGESFEYPYNKIGIYYVTCLNHPFMKLIVQVQPTY